MYTESCCSAKRCIGFWGERKSLPRFRRLLGFERRPLESLYCSSSRNFQLSDDLKPAGVEVKERLSYKGFRGLGVILMSSCLKGEISMDLMSKFQIKSKIQFLNPTDIFIYISTARTYQL